MRNFLHTLTTPEEWHPVSVAIVGLAFIWALAILAGGAFDAQFQEEFQGGKQFQGRESMRVKPGQNAQVDGPKGGGSLLIKIL